MKKQDVLDRLRGLQGDEQCKIVATVVYEGDVNWVGRIIEKSLLTPFTVGVGNINTTYQVVTVEEK